MLILLKRYQQNESLKRFLDTNFTKDILTARSTQPPSTLILTLTIIVVMFTKTMENVSSKKKKKQHQHQHNTNKMGEKE